MANDPVESIEYEDRYARSPWSVLLLSMVVEIFKQPTLKDVRLVTYLEDSHDQPTKLWHNYVSTGDFDIVVPCLLNAVTETDAKVIIKDRLSDVSHRRLLTLRLRSGKSMKCSFDQGMGYWVSKKRYGAGSTYNFSGGLPDQLQSFLEALKHLEIVNIGNWPTQIVFYTKDPK